MKFSSRTGVYFLHFFLGSNFFWNKQKKIYGSIATIFFWVGRFWVGLVGWQQTRQTNIFFKCSLSCIIILFLFYNRMKMVISWVIENRTTRLPCSTMCTGWYHATNSTDAPTCCQSSNNSMIRFDYCYSLLLSFDINKQ